MGAVFGGGLTSTWLQLRNQRRVERNERREKYADVLIDTQALIDVTTAARYLASWEGGKTREKAEEWEASIQRARARVSGPLKRLADTHPSAQVRELAELLVWETGVLLRETRRSMKRQLDVELDEDALIEIGEDEHRLEAERLLRKLRDSI
jgi:hypothetical protein